MLVQYTTNMINNYQICSRIQYITSKPFKNKFNIVGFSYQDFYFVVNPPKNDSRLVSYLTKKINHASTCSLSKTSCCTRQYVLWASKHYTNHPRLWKTIQDSRDQSKESRGELGDTSSFASQSVIVMSDTQISKVMGTFCWVFPSLYCISSKKIQLNAIIYASFLSWTSKQDFYWKNIIILSVHKLTNSHSLALCWIRQSCRPKLKMIVLFFRGFSYPCRNKCIKCVSKAYQN